MPTKEIWNRTVIQHLGYNPTVQFMDQGRVNQLVNCMAKDLVTFEIKHGNEIGTQLWSQVAREIAVKNFDTYKGFAWSGVATWRKLFRYHIKKLKGATI